MEEGDRVIINHKDKWVFIHVQKTASTAVGRALMDADKNNQFVKNRKHDTSGEVIKNFKIGPEWKIVGFVRNPWERLVSWWNMHTTGNQRGAWVAWVRKNCPTFKDWLRNDRYFRANDDGLKWIRLPQYCYLHQPDRPPTFIGRYENLQEDYKRMCRVLGVKSPAPLPHVRSANSKPHPPYQTYYDDESREWVRRWYELDIEVFGYDFEPLPEGA